ncbi:hypothetical protein [Chitinivorax sp. B]|uniref:hypothetical protein n=1 Tax=Chitinivorax sp. B TaxID=2502235 RepID=UPI0010FA15D9|nr:hypothetical protein [Chitinivorax sp. B]
MHNPKILSWLSKRAGISEEQAHCLWLRAVRRAELYFDETERATPAYWQFALRELRTALDQIGRQHQWHHDVPAHVPQWLTEVAEWQANYLMNSMLIWRNVTLASSRAWANAWQQSRAA